MEIRVVKKLDLRSRNTASLTRTSFPGDSGCTPPNSRVLSGVLKGKTTVTRLISLRTVELFDRKAQKRNSLCRKQCLVEARS